MNNRFTFQASALGLALLVTLGTLGALNSIATREHAGFIAANTPAEVAVQQVVVIGHRAPRS